MNKFNKYILALIIVCGIASCVPYGKNNNLEYYNIIILSDMSSRIQNRPIKDVEEIKTIIEYFKEECVKPGEKIGDKSSLMFSTFSNKNIVSIDLSKIKTLSEKQQFVNSTGAYKQNGLNQKLIEFEKGVEETYRDIRNNGIDLISVLIDYIDHSGAIKQNTYITDGRDTTFVSFKNVLYIFTDGYLEYIGKNINNEYYFGNNEIHKLRKYAVANNVNIKVALEKNKEFGLKPHLSDNNRLIDLRIMETHERDKNEQYQTYNNPKGLRDNEILEAVWRKWAEESGFRSFEWNKY